MLARGAGLDVEVAWLRGAMVLQNEGETGPAVAAAKGDGLKDVDESMKASVATSSCPP